MLELNDLKKYIINELKIAPNDLLCKNKIIKSDYIIAALCKEEIFFPKDCEMLGLVNGIIKKDYNCIIKILSIDMCATVVYDCDYIKRDFIKALIGEHFC